MAAFLIRLLLGLGIAAAVFVPLERVFRLRRQRRFRPGWRTDAVHFLLTHLLTQAATVVVAAPFVLLVRALVPAGLSDAVTAQPTALQVLELLLIVDVGAYWGHRLAHRVPWWWRLHRVHHSSEQLDWLAAARLHPLDAALTRTVAVVPAAAFGFGASPLGGAVVVLTAYAVLLHANVRWSYGPLRWVVASPHYHHWHHTGDVEGRDRNFSGFLPVVDVVFGTAGRPDGASWPGRYGADAPVPPGWFGQMVQPLRRPPQGCERDRAVTRAANG
jgi:sterol desaturase/sphingolipid hydroxylase (fatty acid hydroxylase superfamily)